MVSPAVRPTAPPVVLSFDVEEHHRIEAAVGLPVSYESRRVYADRMEAATRGLLDQLGAAGAVATFFVVGEIAVARPRLVRDIAAAGHEVGSHGHDHRRVHKFNPATFRADLVRSRDALEQAAGVDVVGYRAPTFSVMADTAWAVDVLADAGFRYDSSVFPVRHDRYGVPAAPRSPFVVRGHARELIELPPATWRVAGQNLPVAGGGYFRLFPPAAMRAGVNQLARGGDPAVLYFHPWEFDADQPRLPLPRLSKWRTYVGVRKTTDRLGRLLATYRGRFATASAVAADLNPDLLQRYSLAPVSPLTADVMAGWRPSKPGPASTPRLRPARPHLAAASPAPAPLAGGTVPAG